MPPAVWSELASCYRHQHSNQSAITKDCHHWWQNFCHYCSWLLISVKSYKTVLSLSSKDLLYRQNNICLLKNISPTQYHVIISNPFQYWFLHSFHVIVVIALVHGSIFSILLRYILNAVLFIFGSELVLKSAEFLRWEIYFSSHQFGKGNTISSGFSNVLCFAFKMAEPFLMLEIISFTHQHSFEISKTAMNVRTHLSASRWQQTSLNSH